MLAHNEFTKDNELQYAVIGTGAIGAYYGTLLQERAGCKVDFIDTWRPNVEKVRSQGGLSVAEKDENYHLVHANIFYPEEYSGDPDVWIIFVKQQQLDNVLSRCSHLFNDHQLVFSAMNGHGHFEKIAHYVKPEHIVGGIAFIGAEMDQPAQVHFEDNERTRAMDMAPYGDVDSGQLSMLQHDFIRATLNPTLVSNFEGMCLSKIVFNSVLNSLCTMYRIRYGELMSFPKADWMIEQLVNEAYDAAAAAGVHLLNTRDEERKRIIDVATGSSHYPSMYQDLIHHRPTEVDYLNGYIVQLGRKFGYDCKLHAFLTQEVHLAELVGNSRTA